MKKKFGKMVRSMHMENPSAERERKRERTETKKRGRQSSARSAIHRPRPSLRSHLHPRGCLHSRSHVRRVQRSLPQLRSSHVGPEGHAPHVRARSGGWRRHGRCRSSSPHVCVSSLSLPRARGQPEPLSSCALPCFSDTPAFSPPSSCSWSTFYPLGPENRVLFL